MDPLPPDTVIRHPRERKAKCTLQPLRGLPGLRLLTARPGFRFDATGFVLLCLDAPVLSAADRDRPLLLLDSTWRLLPALEATLTGSPLRRSLPCWIRTAYPRTSKLAADPPAGLASVEALYAARFLQGRPAASLLDHYHWKDPFLRQFGPA